MLRIIENPTYLLYQNGWFDIMNKKICILGLGYIGLPTASMFATQGYEVIGVDLNEDIIKSMKNGNIHIDEPGLEIMALAALKSNKLKVQLKPENADVYIICVPTPIDIENKKANLSYVKSAAESLVPFLKKDMLVILESTVPPKTTENVLIPILEESGLVAGDEFYVAYCPERVLPGKILTELVKNDRIIGGFNKRSALMAKELYRTFVEGDIPITDCTTAEMVKLMENTYRDVNIALANEFMKVSEVIGINVWDAITFANKHPRIFIHKPGPGVGGHCIAVDPWFIIDTDRENTELIQTARKVNDGIPEFIVNLVEKELHGLNEPVITVFGVAYKGNVGDTRESPAINIITKLKEKGNTIRIYDPLVKSFQYELSSLNESVEGSDCILVLADHDVFNELDLKQIFSKMRTRNVIDTRNSLSKTWEENGFCTRTLGVIID
jgi:UDP-N-acetyl-D-mannosaminuronic acid dehydrogenase